jgi:hypothetical protein
MEPINPDKYYIYSGKIEVDGKVGKGKVKIWFDEETGKRQERILSFEERGHE